MPTVTQEHHMEAFTTWLKSVAFMSPSHNFKFQNLEEGCIGIATKDIPGGEALCSIPLSSIISVENILKDPREEVATAFQTLFNDYQVDDRHIMILFLAHERYVAGDTSRWTEYLRAIPRDFTTTVWFDETTFEYIKGTPLETATLRRLQQIQATQEGLAGILAEVFPALARELTLENFMWAFSAFWSRVFAGPSRPSVDDDIPPDMVEYLVPGLDFLNHRVPSNTNWEVDFGPDDENEETECNRKEAAITYRASQFIPAGDEVINSYGEKGNEELLFLYGFTLESNPHDRALVLLRIEPDETAPELAELRMGLVSGLDLATPAFLKWQSDAAVGGRGVVGHDILVRARILAVEDGDKEHIEEWVTDCQSGKSRALSAANELRALTMLDGVLRGSLDTLESGTGDQASDEAILSADGDSKLGRSALDCVRYRLGLKLLYKQACEEMDQMRQDFMMSHRHAVSTEIDAILGDSD